MLESLVSDNVYVVCVKEDVFVDIEVFNITDQWLSERDSSAGMLQFLVLSL